MARRWRKVAEMRLRAKYDGDLPWYLQDKLESAAQSSLLGLEIGPFARHSAEAVRWRALAVGDSCLVHCAADRVLTTFPVSRSSAFGNDPALIPACADAGAALLDAVQCNEGIAMPGDRVYLMTDALAAWFLGECEAGSQPTRELDALIDAQDGARFIEWVNAARDAGGMKNDDVTVLRVTFQ